MVTQNDDEFQTRRESELRWKAHEADHEMLAASIRTATDAVDRERLVHTLAHEAAHTAHNREHTLNDKSSDIALDAHHKEHSLEKDARDKAEKAIDSRLLTMNEFRAQLKDQASTFARVDTIQALTDRVIAIEKLDIKGEGRTLGQGAVLAAIIGVVSFVATVLGIIIVVVNVATSA